MTPIITIDDPIGGSLIDIKTDHTFAASEKNVRAEYVSKKGRQTYESLGWMNGQNILLEIPKHVKVEEVKYRETGYDTVQSGEFYCDSPFYTEFWKRGDEHALHKYAR